MVRKEGRRASDVCAAAEIPDRHGRARRGGQVLAGSECRSKRGANSSRRARPRDPLARHEGDLGMRQSRELGGEPIVERVADRERPERLLREAGRFGDHQKQPALDGQQIVAGPTLDRRHDQRLNRRPHAPGLRRPSGACDPRAVAIGDDGELCAQLLPVCIRHREHRGGVGGEPGVGHVRAKDGKGGDQPRLRRRGGRLIGDEMVEGPACRLEVERGAVERAGRDQPRGRNEDRGEGKGNEQTRSGDHDGLDAPVPGNAGAGTLRSRHRFSGVSGSRSARRPSPSGRAGSNPADEGSRSARSRHGAAAPARRRSGASRGWRTPDRCRS